MSCKEWLDAEPLATDGVYTLSPAEEPAFYAYCDMTNGGFTLVLKVDGNANTFLHGSALWTNKTAHNIASSGLDTTEAKLPSFWTVPVGELRLGMIDGGTTRWIQVTLPDTVASLHALMGEETHVSLGNDEWKKLVADGSIQTKCNWEGINVKGRLRIGLLGDENNGCGDNPSPDSFIGFGGKTWISGEAACGNWAHWYPDDYDRNTRTFGYVMVR